MSKSVFVCETAKKLFRTRVHNEFMEFSTYSSIHFAFNCSLQWKWMYLKHLKLKQHKPKTIEKNERIITFSIINFFFAAWACVYSSYFSQWEDLYICYVAWWQHEISFLNCCNEVKSPQSSALFSSSFLKGEMNVARKRTLFVQTSLCALKRIQLLRWKWHFFRIFANSHLDVRISTAGTLTFLKMLNSNSNLAYFFFGSSLHTRGNVLTSNAEAERGNRKEKEETYIEIFHGEFLWISEKWLPLMHCNFFFASWFLSIWFPHRLRNRLPTNPSLFIWSNCLVSHLLPYAIFEPITCSRIGTCWHTDIYLIEIWWKFTRFFSSPQLRSFLQLTSGMRFFLSRLFISCTVNTFEEFHSATVQLRVCLAPIRFYFTSQPKSQYFLSFTILGMI